MSRCPHCGKLADDPTVTSSMAPEAADGFTMGRRGGSSDVPSMYKESPSKTGLWKHGWNLGDAVRRQVEDSE